MKCFLLPFITAEYIPTNPYRSKLPIVLDCMRDSFTLLDNITISGRMSANFDAVLTISFLR